MITDAQTSFSTAQAVTVTAVSTNFYDTGATTPIRVVGRGEELRAIVSVMQAVTAAGAATVVFELVQADDAAGTVNVETLVAGPAIPKAQLVNPSAPVFDVVIPANTRRFIGMRYTVAAGPLTAGQFTAGIVHDSDYQRQYASGYPNAY